MSVDLLIRGGRIIDGTGMPGFTGDLVITDGKIVAVGSAGDRQAERVIDADGLVVAPGFVDHHTHLDAQLLWEPLGISSCWHGVTTVVTGNCSLTLYPCKPEDRDALVGSFVRVEAMSREALEAGVPWSWGSAAEYYQTLGQRLGINVACHVGHSAIRQYVLGEASSERTSTPAEIEQMKALLREALHAGAIGFSTNQSPNHLREDGRPIPSVLAADEELVALSGVLREFNTGVIQMNQGSVGIHRSAEQAMTLAKAVAAASGRPVLSGSILHRWSTPDEWRKLLNAVSEAAAEGHRLFGLTSSRPITFRFTLKNAQVFDSLPSWRPLFIDPNLATRIAAFQDPETRARLRYDAVEDPTPRNFSKRWDQVILLEAKQPHNRAQEGKSVAEIARLRGQDVLDSFLDIALEEDLDTVFEMVRVQGDEAAVAAILNSPNILIGLSDAGAHTAFDAGYGYCTYLLGHWVRERGLMTIEQAVRALTYVPASIFGLFDRGLLRPGMAADVVIFDPQTVGPRPPVLVHDYPAGAGRLDQPAVGVIATVVNGRLVTEQGKHTGALPGRQLKNSAQGIRAGAAGAS